MTNILRIAPVLLAFIFVLNSCSQKPGCKTFKELNVNAEELNGAWYGDSSGHFADHLIFIQVNGNELNIVAKEFFMQERVYFKGKVQENPVKGTYYQSSPAGGGMSLETERECELRVYSKDSVELFFSERRREPYVRWHGKTYRDLK